MIIKNYIDALQEVETDKVAGIKHTIVSEGEQLGYHVAEITEKVNPHVHLQGDEIYHILEGEGEILYGKVKKVGGTYKKKENLIKTVRKGDIFIIPPGYFHSLTNTGTGKLLIGFICPPEHLSTDRFLIKD